MNSELFKKLMQLQWLIRRDRFRRYAEKGHMADTTRGQGRILAVLKLRDGVSTRDLSYLLGVRVSSLNETLAKMEKAGYVTREPSEQDKRVMLVKLTDKGRAEEQPDEREHTGVFDCLTDDERAALEAMLDKMIASLREGFTEEDEAFFAKMRDLRGQFGAPFGGRFHGYGGFGFERFGRGDF